MGEEDKTVAFKILSDRCMAMRRNGGLWILCRQMKFALGILFNADIVG